MRYIKKIEAWEMMSLLTIYLYSLWFN